MTMNIKLKAGDRIEWNFGSPGLLITDALLRGSGIILAMRTDDPDPWVAALMQVQTDGGERLHIPNDGVNVRLAEEGPIL